MKTKIKLIHLNNSNEISATSCSLANEDLITDKHTVTEKGNYSYQIPISEATNATLAYPLNDEDNHCREVGKVDVTDEISGTLLLDDFGKWPRSGIWRARTSG